MKYQVLFSLKNNEEIFMNVVCCSCDWCFKGKVLPDVVDFPTPPLPDATTITFLTPDIGVCLGRPLAINFF